MPVLIVKRVKVSLELFRMSVSFLVTYASNVYTAMLPNLLFPLPPVTMLALQTAYINLQNSAVAAATGGPEQTADMKAKREILINLLTTLGHYVEDIANTPVNAPDASVIILSAGMKTKGFTPRQKQVFAVFGGMLVGTVLAKAAAVRRGTHEWQYTLSPGEVGSWIALPNTTKAHTTIPGLTSATVVYVRHRTDLKTGPTNWDPQLTVVVP